MEQKLDFQTMENIEGGLSACAKSAISLAMGAGALVGLSASMGVGWFVFTAAEGLFRFVLCHFPVRFVPL